MRYITFGIFLTILVSASKTNANESHDIYNSQSQSAFSNVSRHVIESHSLKGKRTIDISLPVNYLETGSKVTYPLIVVLDGELLFHSVSGFAQFQAMNSQMPEAIVVGIQNAPDTRRDMTPKPINANGEPLWFGGKEDQYLSFIQHEVLPFLEENYRIANFKVLIGLSPSASFTLHSFWKQPRLFSGYIVINQADFKAVGYGKETIFDKVIESVRQQPEDKRYLYISMPKGGAIRNPKIVDDYEKLEKALSPYLPQKVSFKWELIDKQSYAAVLPAIMSGFELIFPAQKWDVNYRKFVTGENGATLSNIKAHFSALSEQYGFMALPKGERFYNRNRLKRIVYVLINEERYTEAEAIVQYWLSLYPHSANAYDTFADLHLARGEKDMALKQRKKALELARRNNDHRVMIFEEALNNLKSTKK